MRTAYRMLAAAASCAALIGFLGCQEDNEKNVLNNSAAAGKNVDPKAPSSYEQLQPKPVTNPAAAAIAPLVKSNAPAQPDAKK
jgi:hypothetical protein